MRLRNGIPYRTLGRTGERVSLVGLGGFHLGVQQDEQGSIRIIRTALDNGVNFLDNSWDYHGGQSEIRMGKALKDGYRQKAFLMTKIDGRTRDEAARQIDESLRRLGVEHVDLLQFHEVIRMEDPDVIFGPDGALEAMLQARQQGKLRFIGFTGHKDPAVHIHVLEVADRHGFRFDTVQLPLNVMDHHYQGHSFERQVLPRLVQEGIGVLGMKPVGAGRILRTGAVSPLECLHYAMNLPTSVVITGCDSLPILQQSLEAARAFHPLSEPEVQAILARTAELGRWGEYEAYKTTWVHDSTAMHPEWLGEQAA